ncbi:ARM like helical domain [Trypanosoma vivax]|nr:ARM like helical domain [Trypanosoma vivax]
MGRGEDTGATASPGTVLLREVENLSKAARCKRIVDVGRAARGGGEGCAEHLLLIELSRSAVPYERLTGALGLWQTGYFSETMRLLMDPCDRVARMAMLPAAKGLQDGDVLHLFRELPSARLRVFCGHLERAGRIAGLLDLYFASPPPPAEKGRVAPPLLWASESVLGSRPRSLFRSLDKGDWNIIARRNPGFAAAVVKRELADEDEPSTATASQAHLVLRALRRFHPSIGLDLLRAVLPRGCAMWDDVGAYARMYPAEVTELVLGCKRGKVPMTKRVIKKLGHDAVLALSDADQFSGGCFLELFSCSPRHVRDVLYEQRRSRLLRPDGYMDIEVIASIASAAEREKEALRALNECERLRLDPKEWVSYLSPLPFPQAVAMGRQHLRDQDHYVRAALCNAIVTGGQYHPEYLGDILDFCAQRNRENDIVRREILWNMSCVPPSRWREGHFAQITGIIMAALEALDLSPDSLDSCQRLVLRSAHFSTVLVDTLLVSLVRKSGGIYHGYKDLSLPRPAAGRVWSCLEPWLIEAGNGPDAHAVAETVCTVYPHVRNIDAAVQFLKTCCQCDCPLLNTAFYTLLRYSRPVGLEMLPAVLNMKPEWIYMQEVSETLSVSLQGELLSRYLVAQKLGEWNGYASPSDAPSFNGYHWTAEKQQTYARTLAHMLSTYVHAPRCCRAVFCSLASLYSANISEVVAPLVCKDAPNAALMQRSIHLLGGLKDPESLRLLSTMLEDDRSRVAVYAIGRRIRLLSTPQTLELLKGALRSEMVAVRKVAIRLCGAKMDEKAYAYLLQVRSAGGLHVDVEIALLQAMFHFLHKHEVWEFLYQAAAGERPLALAATKVPVDKAEEEWQKSALSRLFLRLLSRDDSYIVVSALEVLEVTPLPRYDAELKTRLLHLLRTPPPGDVFQSVLRAVAVSSVAASEIATVLGSAERDSDLQANVCVHCESLRDLGSRFKSIVRELVDVLLRDRRQPMLICRLICWLPAVQMGQYLEALHTSDLIHAGCVRPFVDGAPHYCDDVCGISAIEERMRTHDNPFIQRIALEFLYQVVLKAGWNEARLSAMQVYCNASDMWVSDTAKVSLPRAS